MKKGKLLSILASSAVVAFALGACANSGKKGYYTYNTWTTVSPSNWNELTYQDANDTDIIGFCSSGFFEFNFKFDAEGEIIDGEFAVEKSAATDLVDVTESFAGKDGYAVPDGAKAGYAYEIKLRDDLKWDDGTPIAGKDFIYSMKEQLNPLFFNYRADSFYNGAMVIHNAHDYLFQGKSGLSTARVLGEYKEELDSQLIFSTRKTVKINDVEVELIEPSNIYTFGQSYDCADGREFLINYLGAPAAWIDAMEGKTLAAIKADATLSQYWAALIGAWQTEPNEELDFFVTSYTFPEMDFSKVGLFVKEGTANTLVIVMDSPIELLKEDGSLSYKAAYNFAGLPLVKEDLYEKCKVAPASEGGYWTTNYNTSLEKSASWGPYKLTKFQSGKKYVLSRNENWYGYGMDLYKGQYQTDEISCETLPEWNTAWLSFQKGNVATIGIDVSIADDYKSSSRAVYSGDDYVGSLQLQSDREALKQREKAGVDKEILTIPEFRKAISLSIDRSAYTKACTTACLPGFGLFNEYHYYDVANGGVYRHTDQAKKTICDVYAVDTSKYDSLDDAYNSVTGFNLEAARALYTEAFNKAKEAGFISDSDKVVLTYGSSVDSASVRRAYDFLNNAFKEAVVGTPLEGKFELDFDGSFGDSWAKSFRAGAYDLCAGGWSGAAWDPGYFLLAYLGDGYRYATAWKPDEQILALDPDGEGEEYSTMSASLSTWYNALNGSLFGEGFVDAEIRLNIIAALEGEILKTYYCVPIYNYYSATLVSNKIEYGTENYNTFMDFGGVRYVTYNYDDYGWNNVKSKQNYKN